MARIARIALIAVCLLAPHAARADGDVPPAMNVEGDSYMDTDPSALSEFQQPLAAHGQWVDDPTYGTIWIPNANEVGPDFAPYESAGHWVWDDAADGYVWVSDYDWGWITFHYGRWISDDTHAWSWVPGRAYSGAWVSWYVGPPGFGYVGWAPLSATWIWRGGVAVGIGPSAPRRAYYVRQEDIFAPRLRDRVLLGDHAGEVGREMRGIPRGPSPKSLAIEPERVAHPRVNDPGIAHARAYARPSTAQVFGARPPAPRVVRPSAPSPAPRGPAPRGRR